MRAVLGISLIFVGLLLGYLVLAGKFPPASTSASSSTSSGNGLTATYTGSGSSGIVPFTQSGGGISVAPTTTGLPTTIALANGNGYQASGGFLSV